MKLRILQNDGDTYTIVDTEDGKMVELETVCTKELAQQWALEYERKDAISKLTRLLAGETVEGLKIGSPGITRTWVTNSLKVLRS